MLTSKNTRNEDIECLRAVAIVFVLISHAGILFGGWGEGLDEIQHYIWLGSGVDLFFAISGFVITRSFLQMNPTGGFRLAALPFWIKRAFRTLPPALFWIAIGLAATALFNRSGIFGSFEANAADALAALLQYANLHLWSCNDLQTTICGVGGVPLGIYWSLSLEEQFYFLFPFVILLAPRPWLVPLLIVAAGVQIFTPKSGLTFWMRSDALILGVLIALASQHPSYEFFAPRFLSQPLWKALTFVALATAVLLAAAPNFQFTPYGFGFLALACALWVFIASFDADYVMPRGLLKPVILWVASRSYALYLCHMVAYGTSVDLWFRIGRSEALADRLQKNAFLQDIDALRFVFELSLHNNFKAAIALGVTGTMVLFVFAEATYRLIDRPATALGRRLASRLTQSHL
jgi:peptidoglycan/LPS O-acetylase OafA/YrhL